MLYSVDCWLWCTLSVVPFFFFVLTTNNVSEDCFICTTCVRQHAKRRLKSKICIPSIHFLPLVQSQLPWGESSKLLVCCKTVKTFRLTYKSRFHFSVFIFSNNCCEHKSVWLCDDVTGTTGAIRGQIPLPHSREVYCI